MAQHPVRSVGTREHDELRAILRERRESAQVSQEELSRRIGRPNTYVGKIELGSRRLDLVELMELADGIGVDVMEIVSELKRRIGKNSGIE